MDYQEQVDAKYSTMLHIHKVYENILKISEYLIKNDYHDIADKLLDRALIHDLSKLQEPEFTVFMKSTKELKNLVYGSEEYNKSLTNLGDALSHHYSNNRHHPEHHHGGIMNMNIIDILEMSCDWHASSKRMNNSNLGASLDIQKNRFSIPDILFYSIVDIIFYLENKIDHIDIVERLQSLNLNRQV